MLNSYQARAAAKLRRWLDRFGIMVRRVGAGTPNRAQIAGLLGLHPDDEYARQRMRQHDQTIALLSGCSPANSSPAALVGYVAEAALCFDETMRWIELSLGELGAARPRVLEIGSNPYFLTLLMAERFPQVEHFGVNYFGGCLPAGAMQTDAITDDRRRLASSRFLHADIERHDLAATGQFDLALFCEVLEHLPYDPAWALYNIARRVRPGGHLILTTPNPARFENIVRLIEGRLTINDPISGNGLHGRHNREYTAGELREMLGGSGFRVLSAQTTDVIPDSYSHDAEARGYGAYHMLRAVLDGEARLFRPAWLYRGFAAEVLADRQSIAPRDGA